MERTVLGVSQLNRYIAEIFSENKLFSGIFVRGEISNLNDHYTSGHIYLNLKDEGSVIKAVIFKGDAMRLKFKLSEGMKVVTFGRVGVYEKGGSYQLYISEVIPDGEGALWLAFEELKKRLSEEGLFDESHKRKIPKYPEKIGIVTSPSGAAVQDMINIISRRYPLAEMLIYPTSVQGVGASKEIADAIKKANQDNLADVLLVGRGGGSIEDLWAFNEEITVRAIYNSEIPVISAVGHETDFTLSDFAADMRAPTPSAAAELATPDVKELTLKIKESKIRLARALDKKATSGKEKTERLIERLLRNTEKYFTDKETELDWLKERLQISYKEILKEKLQKIALNEAKLKTLNPKAVLKRGYAVVTLSGKPVTEASALQMGASVTIEFSKGEAEAEIKTVKEE